MDSSTYKVFPTNAHEPLNGLNLNFFWLLLLDHQILSSDFQVLISMIPRCVSTIKLSWPCELFFALVYSNLYVFRIRITIHFQGSKPPNTLQRRIKYLTLRCKVKFQGFKEYLLTFRSCKKEKKMLME